MSKQLSLIEMDFKSFIEKVINLNMDIIITNPSKLIFDNRCFESCKLHCNNFNSRCFCPPQSHKYIKTITSMKYVIILPKTYDFSELTHFINNPNDLNQEYIFNNRVYVRRWAQNDYYGRVKKIFNLWRTNFKGFLSSGFSNEKCNKCYTLKIPLKTNCIHYPSPEALSIDVSKTLRQFNYHIKFGIETRMTKISMIFTNSIPQEFINYRFINDYNKLLTEYQPKNMIVELQLSIPNVLFEVIDTNDSEFRLKLMSKNYFCLKWKHVIKITSKKPISPKILDRIHELTFMNNNYYAFQMSSTDLFENNMNINEFYEFINE